MELFLNKLNIHEITTSITLGDSSLIRETLEKILFYLGDDIKNEHKEKIVLEWYRREEQFNFQI